MSTKRIFLNKYFLVGAAFLIWMLYFDQNSIWRHIQINKELEVLHEEENYYQKKIESEGAQLFRLKKDPKEVEKIAREKYLMKKKNEDIFLIKKIDPKQE